DAALRAIQVRHHLLEQILSEAGLKACGKQIVGRGILLGLEVAAERINPAGRRSILLDPEKGATADQAKQYYEDQDCGPELSAGSTWRAGAIVGRGPRSPGSPRHVGIGTVLVALSLADRLAIAIVVGIVGPRVVVVTRHRSPATI